MTGMLASVADLAEARLAAAAGVDIIDLKAPRSGALGALPTETVRAIVAELHGPKPLSATIGDLPMNPPAVLAAVHEMAATGVDYVKIGFFPSGDWAGTVDALEPVAASGISLIAVLFADQALDLGRVHRLARAGFAGVMLDTMVKSRGSLTELRSPDALSGFVHRVKDSGMLCGLAGSLRAADIEPLLELKPDYLGFRGALCHGSKRVAGLDGAALAGIRAMLNRTTSAPAY